MGKERTLNEFCDDRIRRSCLFLFISARCGEAYILMTEINYDYELKSPNYPLSYPAGVGCWWLVYAKNRVTPIRIEIKEFLTETVRDVLLFEPFGGTSQSFALHGNSKVRSLVFNNMDSLYISFVGDSTVEYKGFHLEISNVIDQGRPRHNTSAYMLNMDVGSPSVPIPCSQSRFCFLC